MQTRSTNTNPSSDKNNIKSQWLKEKQNPLPNLPVQKPVTDEEETEAPPAKWKILLKKIFLGLALIVTIVFVYIFLLLGEPEDDTQQLQDVEQEKIVHSISPLEVPGETDAANIAQTFGQPVLSMYPGVLPMEGARIYDTAFEGGFARRVTLTYTLSGGEQLLVESIRPTEAISLMGGSGFHLDGNRKYSIGGVDAAWMDNGEIIRVFGQADQAAYCITCPISYEEELTQLLRSTLLTAPVNQQ